MKKFDYGYESEAAEDNWPEYYYLSQGDSTIMEHASYTELPRAASTYAAPQYPHYRAYEKVHMHTNFFILMIAQLGKMASTK